MKILFLLTQDIHSPSGLGRYYPLAKELVKCGNTVTIVALHPDFSSLLERQFVSDGVNINYVAQMHVQKTGNQKKYYSPKQLLWIILKATTALGFAAWKIPTDLVIIGKPHLMNGLPGLLMKYFQRKKLVIDCDDYEAGSSRFENNWQKRIVAVFEKFLPRQADAVTTNTYFMQKNLIDWGVRKNQVFYLPNGVERDRFSEPDFSIIQTLRGRYNLGGKTVISYIGSMSLASHAVNLLVEAFPIVLEKCPEARLLLIGGGEDYDDLLQMSEKLGIIENVHFIGRVPPGEVKHYYYLSDISVDPVRDDQAAQGRCPLKLFESWACGIPFVTSNVGDRALLAGDPPAVLIVAPGDRQALADSIINLINNDDLKELLKTTGLEQVDDFYWDRLVFRALVVYQQIVHP